MINNSTPPEETPSSPQPSPSGLWLGAAMRYGFVLGLYMSVQFALMVFYNLGIFFSLLSLVMLVLTPFLMYYLGRDFRERLMGGYMGYGDAFRFLEGCFLFGLIILTLAFYFGFSHLLSDPAFMSQLKTIIDVFVERYQDQPEVVRRAQQMMYLSAKDLTIQYVYASFWVGLIMNLFIALVLKKKTDSWRP